MSKTMASIKPKNVEPVPGQPNITTNPQPMTPAQKVTGSALITKPK